MINKRYRISLFVLLFFLCCGWGCSKKESVEVSSSMNSIGMEFVLVPAGSFFMGCDKNFESCQLPETPQHRVHITQPFYMGKYEVTQEEWVAIMGKNPSKNKGRTKPVENISWNDVQIFIRKLNEREGTTLYRLPTEAEWEYAARAGTQNTYFFGDEEDRLGEYAWFKENSDERTHAVGKLRPNPLGLYDMYGNVAEWTQDLFGNYSGNEETDPVGVTKGLFRSVRGGNLRDAAWACRSARRDYDSAAAQTPERGFRLVFTVKK